jgi:hypothetical protein
MIDEAFSLAVKDLLFWAPRHAYGPDQGFLKRYIWPWAKWSAVSHDAYSCLQFPRCPFYESAMSAVFYPRLWGDS